jgi:hypothetical protein
MAITRRHKNVRHCEPRASEARQSSVSINLWIASLALAMTSGASYAPADFACVAVKLTVLNLKQVVQSAPI